MSDKCDRNSEEKQTTPLELGWFARASNGEIQTEQGERIPVGEITRVSTNTKTRKPHVQKFPRESCKSRISLTGQQIKTFKSVNWDLKEPVVFKGWVQESKDFHLPFRSQPSSSTRARHAVCSMLVRRVQNHLGVWKHNFQLRKKACWSLHLPTVLIYISEQQRLEESFLMFFFFSFRPISSYSEVSFYCTNSVFSLFPHSTCLFEDLAISIPHQHWILVTSLCIFPWFNCMD